MIKFFTETEDESKYYMEGCEGCDCHDDEHDDNCCCKSCREGCNNPVSEAKKSAETICVAAPKENACVKEFYVDAADVVKHAELNEQSILESLNDVIKCNEQYGMEASNLVIVMSEGTEGYVRSLEEHGANCIRFVNEADDISIDVQVGPNKDEIRVCEDPQEANPLDAVKRQYDTVVVAKDGDEFFMDVEDVQKCAELNCESVIETINGIIAANEEYDMSPDNIRVLVSEGCILYEETLEAMEEAGVIMEAGTNIGDITSFTQLTRKLISTCKQVAGTVKGDKNVNAKAIKSEIESIDKQIARLEEEKENAHKPGFKPSASRIAKSFTMCATRYSISYIMLLLNVRIGTGVVMGLLGGAKAGLRAVSSRPDLGIFPRIYIIISTIGAVRDSIKTVKDYEKSLDEWIKALEDNKEKLEKKLAGME